MIAWLENSWINATLNGLPWAFPISEALHFVGLCLLIGSLAVIDLRLLGFARSLPVRTVHQLLPWTWAGFTINLVTGTIFFLTQPGFYYSNTAFRVKVVLILLAGANALWFQFRVNHQLETWPDNVELPGQVKVMASASLVLWVAVIFFGRFIMYWPPF